MKRTYLNKKDLFQEKKTYLNKKRLISMNKTYFNKKVKENITFFLKVAI